MLVQLLFTMTIAAAQRAAPHLDVLLPSVGLECTTIERLTLALVVNADVVPRSIAGCRRTDSVGWRPRPSGRQT